MFSDPHFMAWPISCASPNQEDKNETDKDGAADFCIALTSDLL